MVRRLSWVVAGRQLAGVLVRRLSWVPSVGACTRLWGSLGGSRWCCLCWRPIFARGRRHFRRGSRCLRDYCRLPTAWGLARVWAQMRDRLRQRRGRRTRLQRVARVFGAAPPPSSAGFHHQQRERRLTRDRRSRRRERQMRTVQCTAPAAATPSEQRVRSARGCCHGLCEGVVFYLIG